MITGFGGVITNFRKLNGVDSKHCHRPQAPHCKAEASLCCGAGVEAAKEKGIGFVDAPVSGGQAGAENGQLVIMCGGETEHYDRAEPIMNCYAKLCKRIGDSGAGQLTKMVNQICIAGLVHITKTT